MNKLNIILGTHGRFGEELVRSAEMIVGKMDNVQSVSLLPESSFEEFMKQVDGVLSELSGPTISLVDLFGGTPCNVFTVLSKKYGNQVITGLNLPMLIDLYLKANNDDQIGVDQLTAACMETLRDSAVHTNVRVDQ